MESVYLSSLTDIQTHPNVRDGRAKYWLLVGGIECLQQILGHRSDAAT